MRVFLYSLAGIPLLLADGVLLYALAPRLAERFTPLEGVALLGGASAYAALRLLLRKPQLRDLVESRCRMNAAHVAILRHLDSHYPFMERHLPIARSGVMRAGSRKK